MKPLTLQEAKDQVAKLHGYNGKNDTWSNFRRQYVQQNVPDRYHDEAAQLYGDSQWNAALEKAAEIAVDTSFESLSEFNNFLEELKRLKR